jgi:hypothetical protein
MIGPKNQTRSSKYGKDSVPPMSAGRPNKIGRANRYYVLPFNVGRQFESASSALPFLSAAAAHLCRSASKLKSNVFLAILPR